MWTVGCDSADCNSRHSTECHTLALINGEEYAIHYAINLFETQTVLRKI